MLLIPSIAPHPALRSYVHHYFMLHLNFRGVAPPPKPMPAEPYQSLYFYPRDVVSKTIFETGEEIANPKSIIVGQQIARVNIGLREDHLVLQVAFNPGGFFRLFGIPMSEFYDISVDSEDVYGREMNEINEQLAGIRDYQQMIDLIENFLLMKLKKVKHEVRPIDHAMQVMLGNPGRSLDELASLACLSVRQFERNFFERIGIGPKMYARVVRFNMTLDYKRARPEAPWLEAAFACGYFDYAHLVRDFKLFTGETPAVVFESDQKSVKSMSENVVFLHPSTSFL